MSSRMKDLPLHYFLANIPPLEKPYPESNPRHLRLNNKTWTLILYYILHEDENFITALPTRGGSQTKIILSQLSRRFRYLITRNPAFWSAFHLRAEEVNNSTSLLLLTKRYMKRCKGYFMQLCIEETYQDGKLVIFGGGHIDIISEIVLPFRSQLWYLQCPLYCDSAVEKFFIQNSSNFAYLEALDITLWSDQYPIKSGCLTISSADRTRSFTALANIPSLRFLSMNSRNAFSPFDVQVTWRTLYLLDLGGTFLSYHHFQRILAECQLLSTGIFEVQIAPQHEINIKSFGRLIHPNIRDLTLTLLNPSNDRRLFDFVFFPHPHDQNHLSEKFWFPLISFPFLHSLTIRLYDKLGWSYSVITRFIQLSANAANLRICRLQDMNDRYPLLELTQKGRTPQQKSLISIDDIINLNKVIPKIQELQLPTSTPISRSLMCRLSTGDLSKLQPLIQLMPG